MNRMKKRILSLVLVLFILSTLITALPTTVSAASSGTCGDNLTWTLDDMGTLTINGTGEMAHYGDVAPWDSKREYIKSVIIKNGVTSISEKVFYECTNLTSVTIGNDVTIIYYGAFEGCVSLTSVTIGSGVTRISNDVFYGCHNLTDVYITDIAKWCNIVFVNSFANPLWYAVKLYLNGEIVTDIIVPDGVPSIGAAAFHGYRNLKSVIIPDSATSIGACAFSQCTNLTSVTIGSGVTSIGDCAFQDCHSLKSVIIHDSVTSIGDGAFSYCFNLGDIYYSGTEEEWGRISIGSYVFYSKNVTIHFNSQNVPVFSVSMMSPSATMKVGDTKQLIANVLPQTATNKTLTWSTNNPLVATVNTNGVVTAKGPGKATITAKSSNGKSASCTVNVLASNDIKYDKYFYGFQNTHDAFGYKYHIEGTKKVSDEGIKFERYIQAGHCIAVASLLSLRKWSGNCFGMSASSVLFFKDILQEKRYWGSANYPCDLFAPNADETTATEEEQGLVRLRQMIELFQVVLCPKKTFNATDVAAEIDKGNPVVLSMYEELFKNGHSVVLYNYTKTGEVYTFDIYDCGRYVTQLTVDNDNYKFAIDKDYGRNEGDVPSWNSFFEYATYNDILGVYNKIKTNNNGGAASLFSIRQEPTYTYVFRSAENMTITNSLGQISTIIDGEVSGEIEDIKVIPSSYLAEEPTYTIILPTDTYTIVGSGDEEITTSFADDYMSASVTAKSSTPITISSDLKEISVDAATGEEYDITYTTYDNIFDEMNLSGTATGTVTTNLNDTDISISGVNTLTASASVSDSVVSANSDSLSNSNEITVKCEETDSVATIQLLSAGTELTEKTALPERLTVAAPAYDLESGTYTEGQVLNFTKDDETIIYYTTDGSIPSADNGIIYSLPIEINKSMTIKAISTKYGYSDSEIVELNYTLPEVDMPQANLESGEYDKVITVELTTGNYEDAIYYTLDGSSPLENGILYTVPINISEDTYLQAYTLRNGCISEVSEYEYTVSPTYPFYFSNSLTNQDGEIITPDNIADITKVKMTLSKLHTGDHTGTFMIAFYGADNRLLYVKSKQATISEETDEVEIDITDDVSSAHKIKAFAWKDLSSIQPICEALEETIIVA